ncbi:MAG: LamG domain-containing protein [Candidatus Bathyarchaeota archaeon]|nr:LamG domain-containing protein [Candidatus Bathyarchaeota archaeon]MDH5787389.1 LamG domain-containing protein [Candidatus Bathyarchaeota archaeon]
MIRYSVNTNRIRYCVRLSLILFIFFGFALPNASGQAYISLVMEPSAVVDSPPVILQDGTVGTSTIYTNNTSAKVSVEAPLFDYVDNNDPDADSNADRGMHSNFTAQQSSPDSVYDVFTEENTAAIVDYVDNNSSDVDSSSDLGTQSNFENQKARDSSYDTLTEANQANTYSLDATGGYMIVGDGTPDWGSTTGTISFWVKMDGSVQGRFWGQDGDMETRWSGTNLVIDWGGTASMTSAYSFSSDTWYFVAIVWDENNNNLFLYVGDENNAPTLDANSLSGTWTSITPVPTENRFLNGLGGNEPLDGHGDDLRYWNVASSLAEIQSDYNETLSGSEPNLQSYFKLDNNFDDIGPNNDDGSGSGSYSFSTDVPFSGDSDYGLDLEVQWTSVIDFLPTEKLCIYTGNLGNEDLRLYYWNGTGWENLAVDLAAYSCNEFIVSLTSTNFTIRFKGGTESSDTIQDQWQIDASLLRVEGAGDKEDAVDNDTSNVDGSDDVGTIINFENMKTIDGMANLTEGEVGGGTVWLWQEDTSGYTSTSSYETFQFWNSWTTNSTTSGTITKIGIYVFANPGNSPQVKLGIYGDNSTNPGSPGSLLGETNAAVVTGAGWLDLDIVGSGVSISASTTYHVAHITNIVPTTQWRYLKTATPVSDYRGSSVWPNLFNPAGSTTKSGSYRYGAYRVGYDECRLDQEIQWTDVPYSLPNENLSIYGGTMGAEDLQVDVWNGTGWETVFTDLSSGWNNQSITDWLTTSNLTIRFKGGNETGDPSQDTWQIDVALIHIWYDGGENYEINLEVQWTSADYTRTNEELCIKTGTFSGSENIQVKVWNSTGSSWHWVMNLTANQWNNVSITSYLTSSTLTVQFLGGTETGDTSEDSWNIDTTLLHVWTDDATYDYVLRVNNTATDSWEIRLKKYADSNIGRLQNCTIYFHNSTDGNLSQIVIESGAFVNETGPWYDVGSLETIYIAMTVEATSKVTSYIYAYLEVRTPGTTTYLQYIIEFEIT